MAHAITALYESLSDIKKAVGILAATLSIGMIMGGLGLEYLSLTPEIARRNASVLDTIAPMVYANDVEIDELQAVDAARDDQMDRIDRAIEQIRLNQCLTLAELRGDGNADRCRSDE